MKALLGALLLLGFFLRVPGPAPAAAEACDRIEPVFGLTSDGSLVEHDYCVGTLVNGFLSPRTIADLGAGAATTLFWGGMLSGNAGVIYGVTQEGDLWWALQEPGRGHLGPLIRVGAEFGDWNGYQYLLSNGRGSLFALDSRGRLLRWVHLGWRDGSDTWAAGPQDLGPGCKQGRMIVATVRGSVSYVAVQDKPAGYAFCSADGMERIASLLPEGIVTRSATRAPAPGVTYALTEGDHRLVRLVLDAGRPLGPRWFVDTITTVPYLTVFTGHALVPGSDESLFKYEWQQPFYDGTYKP